MKKDWLLLLGTAVATVVLALLVIRWLAPQLLGIPKDLQLVRVKKQLPPFYEGIFRRSDFGTQEFLLQDPYTRVRARPLLPEDFAIGPHDILGFRNRSVPNVADVVAIGDSQTYGNNALLEDNWPSQLGRLLASKHPIVYSMATGGWGAVQYLDMFTNATLFQPRVVVVAFYSGNDPLESFAIAYGVEHWAALRPDPRLTGAEAPSVAFPPPESELWHVKFKDGSTTTFSPKLRLASNVPDHPAVKAGYAIMREVAHQISVLAQPFDTKLVFTVIPTKELAFAEKVRRDGIETPADYAELVSAER
jgi:hypothetical protein